MPQDYNSTINLPKTDFPMRAALPQREPEFLKQWQDDRVYEKLMEKNKDKPKHILHDGPPFSNGSIHLGTALNKMLKDFINRYKAMSGYLTPYVPGWDNHGMPIESAIIKKSKLDRKKMDIPEFRDACHDFALNFVDVQREQFMRLGVIGDWENPYLTMDAKFEAEEIKLFGEMYRKGYIYKSLKPVYWCPEDETALAEAEIEYQDDPCVSIYVKFAVKDDKGKLAQYGDISKMYYIIWTTTTWSLPGNEAIALHPREDYVLAKAANGEAYIVAQALLEKTMAMGKIESYEVLAVFKGAELEGTTAQHPFLEHDSKIVLAEYVTMDSGTGCVHTAPGYGADDYVTGKKYGLPISVPIDDRGFQGEAAGKYAGLRYDKSSEAILADMAESGALYASEKISHTYPHCWRCKNPILFRATPQWFCSVAAFKEKAIAACEDVKWFPQWGKDRITGMINDRADWCISRQRHWGLPIPVFYCEDCGKPVCTDETIAKIAEVFGSEGSNAWYKKDVKELLPDSFVCPHCGKTHFTKETDTLDGWFDSGSTNLASFEKEHPSDWPADVYLEGNDQYRGWFQSSLLVAVATRDKGAPFKNLLTHGMVVDGDGRAMHKSLGNGIAPEKIISQYGADLLRLWAAASDYRVDVRASDSIFKQLSQTYLKMRNTSRYILGNLNGFSPDNLVSPEDMLPLDRWAVTRLNALITRATEGYEAYEYHVVAHSVNNFCVVEMSNFYLDVIKDRLYCESENGTARRSAQTAMFLILDSMTRILAPILAFTADEIWQAMPHRKSDDGENVIFNDMPKPFTQYALSTTEMEEFGKLITLREDANLMLEEARAAKLIGKPLEAQIIFTCTGDDKKWIESNSDMLKTMLIVSKVTVADGGAKPCPHFESIKVSVAKADGAKCERCWCVDESVGTSSEHPTLCARCAGVISK